MSATRFVGGGTRSLQVAFVVNEFPSVSETFVAAQVAGLKARGHEVHVYADVNGGHGVVDADACVRYPVRILARLRAPSSIQLGQAAARLAHLRLGVARRWLHALPYGGALAFASMRYAAALDFEPQRYDIIHAHFGPNGLKAAALRAAGVLSGRLIVTFHGFDLSVFLQRAGPDVYKRLFAQADLCLPVTRCWARRLAELGCDPTKIEPHPVGVDCDRLQPVQRERRAGARAQVLSVARLVEKKGIDDALRAVARATQQGSNLHYTIIGDGPERPQLEKLIEELGIAGIVQLAGWRGSEAVAAALVQADLLLQPSVVARDGDEEGLPVVLMEAMATGLPVLSTRHSGIPELVHEGVEGCLVEERDVDMLTNRLVHLLEHPAKRAAMGSAARRAVEAKHDIEELNDQLVVLYRRALTLAEGTVGPMHGAPLG